MDVQILIDLQRPATHSRVHSTSAVSAESNSNSLPITNNNIVSSSDNELDENVHIEVGWYDLLQDFNRSVH
jgi:hypothetical protein